MVPASAFQTHLDNLVDHERGGVFTCSGRRLFGMVDRCGHHLDHPVVVATSLEENRTRVKA